MQRKAEATPLTIEDIKAKADKLGIACSGVPDFARYCRLGLPSRIDTGRMLPPLLFSTADKILDEMEGEL